MSCSIMSFPDNWSEFIHQYEIADKEEVYTNGSMLIPVFRVQQMVEHYFGIRGRDDLIDTWKLRELARKAHAEMLFESADAMLRAADTIEALSAKLNAECELEEVDAYDSAGELVHVLECSACGRTCEHINGSYEYCPHCGRKAVRNA